MSKGHANKSGGKRLARFFLVLIALAAVVGIVWWSWGRITAWAAGSAAYIWRLLGWGIVLVVVSLAILVILLAFRKQSSLIRRWNRWLALASFMTATWGILGLASAGGWIGTALSTALLGNIGPLQMMVGRGLNELGSLLKFHGVK